MPRAGSGSGPGRHGSSSSKTIGSARGFGVSSGGPAVYSSAPRQYYNYESPQPTNIPSYNENYEPPGFSDMYDEAVTAQEEIARMHKHPKNTLESTYKEAVTKYLNILKHGVDMCNADIKAKESSTCKTHKKFYTTTSATYKEFNTNAESRAQEESRAQGGRRRSRSRTRKARSTRMRKSRRM